MAIAICSSLRTIAVGDLPMCQVGHGKENNMKIKFHTIHIKRLLLSFCLGWIPFIVSCGVPAKYMAYHEHPNSIYAATRFDVGFPFAVIHSVKHHTHGPETWVDPEAFIPFIPLAFLDLPLALVVDTATLPIDGYAYYKNSKAYRFWKRAFATGIVNTNNPIDKYFLDKFYVDKFIRKKLAMPLDDVKSNVPSEKVIDCLIDLSTKHNYRLFGELLRCRYLSESQIERLYHLEAERLKNGANLSEISTSQLAKLLKLPNRTTALLYRIAQTDNEFAIAGLLGIEDFPSSEKISILERLMGTSSISIQVQIASHPLTAPEQLVRLASSTNQAVWSAVVRNDATPVEILDVLERKNPSTQFIQLQLARHPLATPEQLARLASSGDRTVLDAVVHNKATSMVTLDMLARKNPESPFIPFIQLRLASHPMVTPEQLARLASSTDPRVLNAIVENKATSVETLEALARKNPESRFIPFIQLRLASHPMVTPVRLAQLASSTDPRILNAVAENKATSVETLEVLTRKRDPSMELIAILNTVAKNKATSMATLEAQAQENPASEFTQLQIASHPMATPEQLARLATSKNQVILYALIQNEAISMEMLDTLAGENRSLISMQIQVACHRTTMPEQLARLASSTNREILLYVARHGATPMEILDVLAHKSTSFVESRRMPDIQKAILQNPTTSAQTIQFLYDNGRNSHLIFLNVARNNLTPIPVLIKFQQLDGGKYWKDVLENPKIKSKSYPEEYRQFFE
jgi:hypothetical protein